MADPLKIEWIDGCAACKVPGGRVLCGMDGDRQQRFEALSQTCLFPKGAVLFVEEGNARGIHIVCSGKVKISFASADGKRVILGIAEPGDILGARAVLTSSPYDATAETLEPSQLRFLPKDHFLRFLEENGDICLRLASELSGKLYSAYAMMRGLALRVPAGQRMAQLLSELVRSHGRRTNEGLLLGLELSREELGEMIGATRETASRILADFERRKIIRSSGRRILVLDATALRSAC